MCLKVFVNGNEEMYTHLEQPAMKLGSAFQKVNFLRDLKADVEELDRSYFPQFRIDTFNDAIKNDLINNIESDFKEAYQGLKQLPPQAKLAVYIAFVYYKQLLRNLQCTPSQKIMEERVRVAAPVKLMLLCKAYVKFQLNMI
jgi:phytoene/squalene synthetase